MYDGQRDVAALRSKVENGCETHGGLRRVRGDGVVRRMLRERWRCAVNITQCLPTVAIGILLGLLPASAQFNMREFLEGHWVGEDL
jgi:hypothetical protein